MCEQAMITYSGLKPERIDRSDYTNSLAMEAYRTGILSEDEFSRLRTNLMESLAEVIGLYTKNESSSVCADTARGLTASMLYNIDTYLLSLNDANHALSILRDRKPYELYGKGYLINRKYFETARHLYGSARFTRLKNASETYNKTLDQYFRYYLTHYDPRFTAQDKIYLSLKEYGITGAYHIREAVGVLQKIIEINKGRPSDVMISANIEENRPGSPSEEK